MAVAKLPQGQGRSRQPIVCVTTPSRGVISGSENGSLRLPLAYVLRLPWETLLDIVLGTLFADRLVDDIHEGESPWVWHGTTMLNVAGIL